MAKPKHWRYTQGMRPFACRRRRCNQDDEISYAAAAVSSASPAPAGSGGGGRAERSTAGQGSRAASPRPGCATPALALQRGNVDHAITLYTEALDDKSLPNDRRATILNDRGVAYSRRLNYKEAIDDFNRAIQLYPEYPAVYNNRGNVLLGLGAVREAIKDFDRALLLAPGYAAAYSNRAGAYMKLGQVEQAIAGYTKAIQLTPTSPAALERTRAGAAGGQPAARRHPRFHARGQPRCSFRCRLSQPRRGQAVDRALRRGDRGLQPRHRLRAAQRRPLSRCAGRRTWNPATRRPRSRISARRWSLAPTRRRRWRRAAWPLRGPRRSTRRSNDFARAIELDPRSPKVYAYRAWTYRQQQQPELALAGRRARLQAGGQQRRGALGARRDLRGAGAHARWRSPTSSGRWCSIRR